MSRTLRIVVFESQGMLVGQCIDYDICTQANDFNSLRDRMEQLIEVEQPFLGQIPEAPERFHKMWSNGVPIQENRYDR